MGKSFILILLVGFLLIEVTESLPVGVYFQFSDLIDWLKSSEKSTTTVEPTTVEPTTVKLTTVEPTTVETTTVDSILTVTGHLRCHWDLGIGIKCQRIM